MTRQAMAYLFLERLAMEADRAGDPFGGEIRDHIEPFWDALSDAERDAMRSRTGVSMDDVNPTKIDPSAFSGAL